MHPNFVHLCCCLQYLLLTDNPEKMPSNKWCTVGSKSPACTPGFFQSRLPQEAADGLAPDMELDKPHACCPGYMCPSMLTCIIPCPLGAYCPRCARQHNLHYAGPARSSISVMQIAPAQRTWHVQQL